MFTTLHSIALVIANLFKSRRRLEAENLLLRLQLNVAVRRVPARLRLRGFERALLVGLVRLWPDLIDVIQVVKPETILRWHRAGFKAYWRWKSRRRAGRPRIDRGLRDLIRRMSRSQATVTELADLSAQSRRGHRRDRSVCGPDGDLRSIVRVPRRWARSAAAVVV